MIRHVMLITARFFMERVITYALPYSHIQWGNPYPGDGQQAFGFILIFALIGVVAATIFFTGGTLARYLLRKRTALLTLAVDLFLFSVFAGMLVYGGVTAVYS